MLLAGVMPPPLFHGKPRPRALDGVSGHVELFDEPTVRVAYPFDLAAFHSQNVGYDGVATAFGQQVVGQHRVFLSISPPTRRALLMHAVAPAELAEDDDPAVVLETVYSSTGAQAHDEHLGLPGQKPAL